MKTKGRGMIMDIEKLAYDHGANIYENGAVRFYTLNAFTKFAEAYHQVKGNEEIQALRAKVASAEVFNLEQILHDPENQPSQYGTVPLEWYENLENKINRIRFNVEQVIDSLSGSYDTHAIRKKLQIAVDEEALATYNKLSEIKE